MKKYYRFAGIDFEIDIPDALMYTEERHMEPFRVDSVTEPHRFRYEVVETLTPPTTDCAVQEASFRVYLENGRRLRYIGSVEQTWENAYARVASCGKDHYVQLKQAQYFQTVGVKTVLNCLGMEHLAAQNWGVVFHSSYIQSDGQAILFTAPSGTGKSTQAELWHTLRGAPIHNGDRSVVRVVDGAAYACGIPFAGSSDYCENVTLPLAAIVYLQQAPRTTIRRLRGAEAFRRVWEGCSVNVWDRDDMEKASATAEQVVSATPVYLLACTPDESAITALEGVLAL